MSATALSINISELRKFTEGVDREVPFIRFLLAHLDKLLAIDPYSITISHGHMGSHINSDYAQNIAIPNDKLSAISRSMETEAERLGCNTVKELLASKIQHVASGSKQKLVVSRQGDKVTTWFESS